MSNPKEIKGAAEKLFVNANFDQSASSFQASSAPSAGWPTGVDNFVVAVGRGTSSEEKILCSSLAGSTFSVDQRGFDGTTASTHSAGEAIEHVLDADTLNDFIDHVYDTSRDDHTQYLKGDPDGTTLELSGATLQVKAGGIGASQIASSGVTAGTYGNTQNVPQIVVDADGRITSAQNVNVAVGSASPSGPAGGALDGEYPDPDLAAAVAGNGLTLTGNVLAVGVDGSTLEINTDALRVKAAGIGVTHIAAAVAGDGLTGGAGSALAVNPDGVGLEISADAVRLKDLGVVTAKINDAAVTLAKVASEAWTSYTPTLTQTVTVTKTVTYAKYHKIGRLVTAQVALAVTGAGTSGAAITIGLPVAAAVTSGLIIGAGRLTDADSGSGALQYPVIVELFSTTTVHLNRTDTNPIGAVGTDPSFALASTDVILFTVQYEAAS